MKLSKPLVVIDLETTGTWIQKDKIIEIGMIRCCSDGREENFIKRVNPGIPIPKDVTDIINITDEDIKNAPSFHEIAEEVVSFIGDADLCGFRIERFDLPLLQRELIEANIKFDMHDRFVYDTQKIYHINEKRDLTAAYKFYCNEDLHEAHSALGDAQATLKVLRAQIDKYGTRGGELDSLKKFDYEISSRYLTKDRQFHWWNGELYPMFGKYARRLNLKEIARKEPRYLEWILSKDFSREVKNAIEEILHYR